jgi:hypothetical protein
MQHPGATALACARGNRSFDSSLFDMANAKDRLDRGDAARSREREFLELGLGADARAPVGGAASRPA